MARVEIENAVRRTDPEGEFSPLVLDSPHTGMLFPEDFRPGLDIKTCEKVADWFVEELFSGGLQNGAIFVEALFRRAYIDPNRALTDIDNAMLSEDWPGEITDSGKGDRGTSLIWRLIEGDKPIYDRKLSVAEVQNRIERYWKPYHQVLAEALHETYERFGVFYHINCHSMPEWGDARWGDGGLRRADFVIGTRDGQTASDEFVEVVRSSLESSGYSVALNELFKGVDLIQRYSNPESRRDSLQIEVNRGIYMDEASITRSERFGATQAAISKMLREVRLLAESKL